MVASYDAKFSLTWFSGIFYESYEMSKCISERVNACISRQTTCSYLTKSSGMFVCLMSDIQIPCHRPYFEKFIGHHGDFRICTNQMHEPTVNNNLDSFK